MLESLTSPQASILGSAANFVGGTVGSLLNYKSSKDNLDYQKALQQQLFDREDTSYQRTVADAQKAGLSPLAVLGNTDSAGSVVQTSAPQFNTPQFDMATIVDAIKNQENIKSSNRNEDVSSDTAKYSTDKNQENVIMQINAEQDVAREKNSSAEKIAKAENESREAVSKGQNETSRANKADDMQMAEKQLNQAIADSTAHWSVEGQKLIQAQCDALSGGKSQAPKVYKSPSEYSVARKYWLDQYNKFLSSWNNSKDARKRSNSASFGGGADVSFVAGANAQGSESNSYDYSDNFNAAERQFFIEHPFPMYGGEGYLLDAYYKYAGGK